MSRPAIILATALAFALPMVAVAAPNLVTNGDFMQTSTTSSNGNFELTNNGQYGTVTGWTTANSPSTNPYNLLFSSNQSTQAGSVLGQYSTAGSGNEYLPGVTTLSPSGGNFMALDGDINVAGALQQNITGLTVGRLYELDFYWGVAELASRNGPVSDYLQVSFGNSTSSTTSYSVPAQGFSGWKTATMYFTAQTTSQLLSFLSVGTPAGLPPIGLLDGVSLTAAPEPSAIALFVVGLGGLGLLRRRKAAKASIAA